MARLEHLPAELELRILDFTSPTNLDSLSQVNRRWYSLASKRLRMHRECRSNFATLDGRYVWRDVLNNILRDPWIGHYVTHLSMDNHGRGRKRTTLIPVSSSGLHNRNVPHSESTPTKEALIDIPFIQAQDLKVFDRISGSMDKTIMVAFLLTLLPNVDQLTMLVSTRCTKLLQAIITRLAITYRHTPKVDLSLRKLKTMEFQGHQHLTYSRNSDLSFIASFIALPKAYTLKIIQMGAQRFTASVDLSPSGLTSLILVRSTFVLQALFALLRQTPQLERFVYFRDQVDARSEITADFGTFAAIIGRSLKFLAFDLPRDFIDYNYRKRSITGHKEALPKLRTMYILSSFYPTSQARQRLSELMLPKLGLLSVGGLSYCSANVKFVRELIADVPCEKLNVGSQFVSPCESLDLELIIEKERLKETCSELNMAIEVKNKFLREEVVLGANEKWRAYL